MKNLITKTVLICSLLIVFTSCKEKQDPTETNKINQQKNEQLFSNTMLKHLNAVTTKDIKTLKTTMSPKGNMQLILPGTEIIETVDGFINYHIAWFKSTGWAFETKILNTTVGEKMGIAITEAVYREADRNGKPYFNRMIVSYGLEKIDGTWYVIKDHASSIEKSTDKK